MLLWLMGGVTAAVWAAFKFGLIPPLNSITVIQIRSGAPLVSKGALPSHAREHIASIVQEARISCGFIAIKPDKRIAFSWQIPSAYHQRFRNVLLN